MNNNQVPFLFLNETAISYLLILYCTSSSMLFLISYSYLRIQVDFSGKEAL